MIDHLRNSGIAFVNENVNRTNSPTIIIVGVARSGTSMIGAALDALGVHLGDHADKTVFEDLEISSMIERDDLGALKALIEKKNSTYQVWGFKRPEAFLRLPKLLPMFRNPRVIATFRDPVAIAKRNEISMEAEFLPVLGLATKRTSELVEFVRKVECPAMLASYEKALSDPPGLIEAVAAFSGIEPTAEQREAAINSVQNGPSAYLDSSRVWTEGYFEGIRDNVAHGWARKMPMKSACEIEIWADGMKIASGKADKPRPDLEATVGPHSFSIPFHNVGYRSFEAQVAGTNVKLKKTRSFLA